MVRFLPRVQAVADHFSAVPPHVADDPECERQCGEDEKRCHGQPFWMVSSSADMSWQPIASRLSAPTVSASIQICASTMGICSGQWLRMVLPVNVPASDSL